ncbi:uncharacterized protein LOC133032420 [Cannabis sativa]|uniref:uncharacterized protein LOC133032420 n=1 Tax=Cannabis sativa TaxID=3483 RepID=UPI0029C9DFD0|nr:uncharacterized protein LOC133032420 [Cannabis sativa]
MYEPSVDPHCLICGVEDEDINHLFFACSYSKKCLKRIKEWLEWKVQTENILELLGKISKAKISKARKSILLTIIASVVYNLWQVRNEALWNQKVWQIKRTIKKIQQDALTRLMGALLSKMSIGDKTWLLKL